VSYVLGEDRSQALLFPECLDDYVLPDNPIRFIDAFVERLELGELGFQKAEPKDMGRPAYHPGMLLRLYVYGYLNSIRSSRKLERDRMRASGGVPAGGSGRSTARIASSSEARVSPSARS